MKIKYNFDVELEYKGYTYGYWDDIEEDNIKRFHEVYDPEGKRLSFPMGPYQGTVSRQTFERWIDMGMPTREQLGGHYQEDHDKYYEMWVHRWFEKEIGLE